MPWVPSNLVTNSNIWLAALLCDIPSLLFAYNHVTILWINAYTNRKKKENLLIINFSISLYSTVVIWTKHLVIRTGLVIVLFLAHCSLLCARVSCLVHVLIYSSLLCLRKRELKISPVIGLLRTRVCKQPIIVLYFMIENELKVL